MSKNKYVDKRFAIGVLIDDTSVLIPLLCAGHRNRGCKKETVSGDDT